MKSTTKYYDFEIFTSLKIEYSSNCWTSFGKKKYDDGDLQPQDIEWKPTSKANGNDKSSNKDPTSGLCRSIHSSMRLAQNIYSIIKKEFTISFQRYADIETTTNHYNITTCQSFFEKAKEKKNSLQILEKNISSEVNN